MKKHLPLWFTVFLLFIISSYSLGQNITLSQLTGGVATGPTLNNTTANVAILGFELVKAGGGAANVTSISISLDETPIGKFINPRLVKSTNNTNFDVADLANLVGSAAFTASSINITTGTNLTNFGGANGAVTESFFIVVDVVNTVNAATNSITPSLTTTNISISSSFTASANITGNTYSFADVASPLITFNPSNGTSGHPLANDITITFNEPIRKIDDSPITNGDLASLLELRLTNSAGAGVPYTATINGSATVITINPTSNLTSNTIYFVLINPVEDAYNNATAITSITFTSQDLDPPVITFNPLDNTVNVPETTNITLSFNEPVRNINNSAITAGNINSIVELRVGSAAGALVPFTGSINGSNTVITIDPTAVLAGNTTYFVRLNPVEDASDNATAVASITFTTGDTQPPSITFNPFNSATNISTVGNITITFNEAARNINDSPITPADITGGLIELRLTNSGGASVPFSATINAGSTIITIDPTSTLLHNQVYFVRVNPVEDVVNNATIAQSITFTTEDRPSITNFSPAGGTCIGDNVTVTGQRFSGTGPSPIATTPPTVSINGVPVAAANIVSYTTTQVVFTLPSSPSGAITVRNNDSDLLSANSASNLNVFPAIDTSLPVSASLLTPAQNTSVDFTVTTTQNNFTYSLIANSTPVGYTATTQTATGNGSNRTLTTTPSLSVIGDYTYRIDVSRTGCTTKTLTATPITVTVAALTVNADATNTTICIGNSTTLIGSVSGGTGFYQFKWTSTPAGFNSTSSSPVVNPTSNIRYNLEVKDNANNIITDFVDITVNPTPTATIIPTPGESTLRTNYTLENNNFRLYGSPAGGTFAGPGVTLQNDGNYYFNPFNAGVGNKNITYTFTNASNCSKSETRVFTVSNFAVTNLKEVYCKAETVQLNLSVFIPNAFVTLDGSGGYQFSRMVFFNGGCDSGDLATSTCGLASPLTKVSDQNVTPVLPGFATSIPNIYSLNINTIRNNYGYSYGTNIARPTEINYFYILIYGRDILGNEQLRSFQFFQLVDNGPAPFIVGINEKQSICSDSNPITLSASINGYAVNQFSITSNIYSGSLTGSVGENFNPGHSSLINNGKSEEKLSIKMDYRDFNNCPASVSTNVNWVRKPNAPFANDVEFCQVTSGLGSSFTIKGSPNGPSDRPFWYEAAAPNVVLDSIRWDFVAPAVTGLTPLVKTYLVNQEYKGCKGAISSVDLEIKPAPTAAFSPPVICQGKDFTINGPIDVQLTQPYVKYEWSFGDGKTIEIMGDRQISYNYTLDGSYDITLRVTNTRGCTNTEVRPITVGLNPKPAFTYKYICEGDFTDFTASTDIPVAQFEWNFGDGQSISAGNANNNVPAPDQGTYISPKHKFKDGSANASGEYNVVVTSITNLGCSSSLGKIVTILDTLKRTNSIPYRMINEESGKGYWRLEDINGNSTWEFAQPTTDLMKAFTTAAWVTNPIGNYEPNERAYVNSPCFNVSTIDRPVVSLDLILDTELNREGAVLEFSKDRGDTWFPLGGVNTGLNWFNTNGFTIGTIGSSTNGWSGNSRNLEDNPNQEILLNAKRSLDNIGNLSKAERSNIRFRISFASDGTGQFEGFGFNNFTIDNRNRISLIENFTNVNAPNYTVNNNAFIAIEELETAKIQYHVSFLGNNVDSNHEVNKADPSARAAYYGIPLNTQYVPRGYIDGLSDGLLSENWVNTRSNKQSLKNSLYELKVESKDTTDRSYFVLKVTIKALENISSSSKPILHLAVVEKTVGNNEFVLRKLVPTAIGTPLPILAKTTSATITRSVRLEHPSIDVSKLSIVAFIQDEITREVYQASVELDPFFLPTAPNLITSIEPGTVDQINLYPNPANKEFKLELPSKVTTDVNLTLIDQVGRVHNSGKISAGSHSATVNVEQLSDGVYILQIGNEKSGIVRKKVMIVNKN